MRRPDFGNVYRHHRSFIIHTTVDGDIKTFEDALFPTFQSLSVQFRAISKQDVDAFIAFFKASAGEEIRITDHEGRDWLGMITSDTLRIIHGKNADCEGSFGFDFQGVPV